MNHIKLFAAACTCSLFAACVADPQPTPTGTSSAGPPATRAEGHAAQLGSDPMVERARQLSLHEWLTAERPAGVLTSPIIVQLTEAELDAVDDQDPDNPGRLKVGITKTLSHAVALHGGDGVTVPTTDGGFLWSVAVTSPGAGATRLGVNHAHLPPGADLFVYNLAGEAQGPYQGDGPHGNGRFWTHSISGDTVVVAVRLYGPATVEDLKATSIVIGDLGFLSTQVQAIDGDATCDFNAPCVENAACFSSADWAPFDTTSNAVAQLLYQSRGSWYICSGGLLADTDDFTERPYLLTANHCLNKGREAKSLEAAFFYTSPACSQQGADSSCPSVFDLGYKVLGASVVATNKTSDYTLLELAGPPPLGATYLGWDATPIASSEGASLHRLGHPKGAPQSYSEHDVDTAAGTCGSWPRGAWIYSADRIGATEGGSSGSPVLNADGYVVGQLSGGCGTDVYNTCNAVDNATVDGALAAYFPDVASLLDPTPCSPTTEVCDDGLDNDCDGAVDCDDADCSGAASCVAGCSGAGTLPLGASCTSDGDCCSGKCKGPPTGKSCR